MKIENLTTKSFLNFSFLFIISFIHSFSQSYSQLDFIKFGKYSVGFNVVEEYDYSRNLYPQKNFEGEPRNLETATPIQISIWYPSTRINNNNLTFKDYISLELKKNDFSINTSNEQILEELKRRISTGLSQEVSDSTSEKIMNSNTAAYANADHAQGVFPLIIAGQDAGPFGNSVLFEFLASHGFVVISSPTLIQTATLQASNPKQALETRVRNMEFIYAYSRELNFIDKNKTAVLGINFDGMAGLIFEMRNLIANAVISLDGWEGKKNGSDILKSSLYFDIIKMRTPYLCFSQDNPPFPGLQANSEIFDMLKYSQRDFYVVKNLEHADYTLNRIAFSVHTEEQKESYRFLYTTVLNFLNKYVKAEVNDNIVLTNNEGILKLSLSAKALPPVPTPDEFENIIMKENNFEKAFKIFREAKKNNPQINIFSEQTINIFAFRFKRMNKTKEALELYKLNCEAFPNSPSSFINLGDGYKLNNDKINATESYKRAIELLLSSGITQEQKEQMINSIQNKINDIDVSNR